MLLLLLLFCSAVQADECQFKINGHIVTADVDVYEFSDEQSAAHYAMVSNGKVIKDNESGIWKVFVWGGIDLPDEFSCGKVTE